MEKILSHAHDVIRKKYKNNNSYEKSYSTISNYIKKVKLYSLEEFAKKSDYVIKNINNLDRPLESKRKVMFLVLTLFNNKEKYKKAIEKYRKAYNKLNFELIEKRDKQEPINEKEEKCLKITYKKLKDIPINNDDLTPHDLIYNLLIHQRNTPRLEYNILKYEPTKDKINYIYKKGKNYFIVLNKYKTSKTYGKWEFKLTKKLSSYFDKYVQEHNIKPNDYVFKNRNGRIYKSNKFSEFVQRSFFIKTGQNININCLRKIKSMAMVHNNKKIKNKSLAFKKQYVKDLFRHNYNVSVIYYEKKLPKEKYSVSYHETNDNIE